MRIIKRTAGTTRLGRDALHAYTASVFTVFVGLLFLKVVPSSLKETLVVSGVGLIIVTFLVTWFVATYMRAVHDPFSERKMIPRMGGMGWKMSIMHGIGCAALLVGVTQGIESLSYRITTLIVVSVVMVNMIMYLQFMIIRRT